MVFETAEGPDLIPADPDLGGADDRLADEPVAERFDELDDFTSDEIASEYDLVILVLPGKEVNIALNGLFAARSVVAPLKPGEFERQQLEPANAVMAEIRDESDVDLQLELVCATVVDRRLDLAKEFIGDLRDEYSAVADEPVSATANTGNEQAQGRTLFALDDDELYESGVRARKHTDRTPTYSPTTFSHDRRHRQSRRTPAAVERAGAPFS